MATPNVPSIPTPPDTDIELNSFLSAVKSALDSMRNSDGTYGGADPAVVEAIVTDITSNIVSGNVTYNITNTGGGVTPPDTTTPPALSGLTVTPGFSTILLAWDAIPYGNASHTNIYRAAVDDFSVAVKVGTSKVLLYADYVDGINSYYYWITSTSKADIEGPVNQVAGTSATVSFDPAYTKLVLANAITATEIVNNAITAAEIANGTITRNELQNGTWGSDVYKQATAPTGTFVINDIWIDTSTGNELYTWDGIAWVSAQDSAIATALSTATNAQATADGKIESFFTAAQPTTGMSTGDLWIDTGNGNKLYRYSGVSWILAQDDGISTAITNASNAQATADGKVTTFFTAATPTALALGDLWFNPTDLLFRRWDGATWAVVSNNYTDTVQLVDSAGLGTTAVWTNISGANKPADNATIGATIGSDLSGVFSDVNIDSYMPSAVIKTAHIKNAAITTALIGTGVITEAHIGVATVLDAFIQNLSASQISTLTLDAFTANLGNITAGLLQSPDGTFTIDLNNKSIIITGPNGQANDNYTIMQNGDVSYYAWNGATHVLAKKLRGIASGTASNGTTVVINSTTFQSQPNIIVTPRDIMIYDSSQSAVSQQLRVLAQNIQETSAGSQIWQFDAVAEIVGAGGINDVIVNEIIGINTANTQTTTPLTTVANTDQITVNLNLKSYRINSSDAVNFYYKYRQAQVTLYSKIAGGGAYAPSAMQTVDFGTSITDISATFIFSGLTSQAHDFYVSITYVDLAGTFAVPSGGYDYAQTTTNPANASTTATNPVHVRVKQTPNTPDLVVAASTSANATVSVPQNVPAGYAIGDLYNVTYAYNFDYTFNDTTRADIPAATTSYDVNDPSGFIYGRSISTAGQTYSGTKTGYGFSGSSYISSFNVSTTIDVTAYNTLVLAVPESGSDGNSNITVQNIVVTNYYKKLKTFDTNPHNKLTFLGYTAHVTGGTTISTGSLNWQAIGE